MINKIIHFIWINFNDEFNTKLNLPKKYVENINNCIKINPGYEIKVWNGTSCYNLVKKHFPNHLKMYENVKYPIQKCDIIRLMIVYVYGGIYSDVDRLCIKPYDILLKKYNKYDVILGKYKNWPHIFNDPIICSKNNKFILNCINNIKIYNLGNRFLDIFISTGPFFITKQYYFYNNKKSIKILDKELNPCNLCNCTLDIKNSITFTAYDNSWIDKNSYETLLKFIYCKFNYVILIVFLIFIYLLKNKYFVIKIQ
jgi:mannosyltransferase OCH1-like enzyme